MWKPNLQFALGALLLLAGVTVSAQAVRTEADLSGAPAHVEEVVSAAPAASGAQTSGVQTVGASPTPDADFSLEMRSVDARGPLGRLAALTGLGVLVLGWLNLKRQLESVEVGP